MKLSESIMSRCNVGIVRNCAARTPKEVGLSLPHELYCRSRPLDALGCQKLLQPARVKKGRLPRICGRDDATRLVERWAHIGHLHVVHVLVRVMVWVRVTLGLGLL